MGDLRDECFKASSDWQDADWGSEAGRITGREESGMIILAVLICTCIYFLLLYLLILNRFGRTLTHVRDRPAKPDSVSMTA